MRHRSSGSPCGPPACPHLPRVPHRWDPQGKQPQFHPFWGCPGHEGCRWLVQEEPQGTQAPLASCLVLDADFMPGYPSAAPQRGRSMNIHLLGEMASTHTRLSDSCQSPSPGRDAGAPGVPAGKDAPGEAAPGLCSCRMTAAGWEALGSGLLWGWALGYGAVLGLGTGIGAALGPDAPWLRALPPRIPRAPPAGPRVGEAPSLLLRAVLTQSLFIYLKYLAGGGGAEERGMGFVVESCWMALSPQQRLAN